MARGSTANLDLEFQVAALKSAVESALNDVEAAAIQDRKDMDPMAELMKPDVQANKRRSLERKRHG